MSQNDTREHIQWRGHFYLPFECGLCGLPVKWHSFVYGLVSTPDSNDLGEVIQPFTFPRLGLSEHFLRIGDWAVGLRRVVEFGLPGPCVECTVIHVDCFRVYTAHSGSSLDALRYLWFFGLWRQPWNRSKTSRGLQPLPRAAFFCSRGAVNFVLDKVGMTNLALAVPQKAICYIFECSRDALLWKVACAVTAAFERSEVQGDYYASIPPLQIKSWTRGDLIPEFLSSSEQAPQSIRFTIDSQGIRLIERIRRPRFSERVWPGNREYVIADNQELLCTDIMFKHGRARLRIPEGHGGFKTWDTPCPPPDPVRPAGIDDDLSGWVENGVSVARMCGQMSASDRFRTAQLANATGVTFIFHKCFLMHIHAHTLENPMAKLPHDIEVLADIGWPELEGFFPKLSWVYLPLPPGEKILSISVGTDGGGMQRIQRPNMMVHTGLAGTVFIGHLTGDYAPCIALCEEPDILFTRLEAAIVSGIGAYREDARWQLRYSAEVRDIPRGSVPAEPSRFDLASYAPLDDVVCLDIVEEPVTGEMRGLLLHYSNGGQRLVGQYHLGYHLLATYHNPQWLCLRSGPLPSSIMSWAGSRYASASSSCDADHEAHLRERGRSCYLLTGHVYGQFNYNFLTLYLKQPEFQPTVDAM